MSNFSELLSIHIKNSKKNKVQIAEAIGMTRTNFQKITTGNRKPQDEHTVEKIMNELVLSLKERKQLWAAFHQDATGNQQYQEHLQCISLLQSISFLPSFSTKEKHSYKLKTDNKTMKINSRIDLIEAFCIILDFMKENQKLQLLFQPEKSCLLKILIPYIKEHKKSKIYHIICFDNHPNKESYAKRNLERFTEILDCIITSADYQAFYYYEDSDAQFGEMSLFPQIILTDELLLCFDRNETTGFLTSNSDLIQVYLKEYRKIYEQTSPIYSCSFNKKLDRSEISNIISYQPLQILSQPPLQHQLFTLEGLQYYFRLHYSKDDRFQSSQAIVLLKQIKTYLDKYDAIYLLKNKYVNLQDNIILTHGKTTNISLCDNKDSSQISLSIQILEQSIQKAFDEFCKYLPLSIFTYSKEESMLLIEELIHFYER